MGLREDILPLAVSFGGKPHRDLDPDEDILGAFAIEGDDADEFLEAFAERFQTDLSGRLWYFHYNANEPPSVPPHVGPVSPDRKRLPLHPITFADLVRAAEPGHWTASYPPHEMRTVFLSHVYRWLAVIVPVSVLLLAAAMLWAWNRFGP